MPLKHISDYQIQLMVDNQLSDAELEQHLLECSKCKASYDFYKTMPDLKLKLSRDFHRTLHLIP